MNNNSMDEVRDRVRGEQLLQATAAGVAPNPASPAGKSLLASYKRWQEREQEQSASVKTMAELSLALETVKSALEQATAATAKAQTSSAIAMPEVKEEAAQTLASGAIRGALLAGSDVPTALSQGFKVYKSKGGRLTDAAWRKSIRQ